MASFSFSFRMALGLLPKTEKIENNYNQLVDEYNKLLEYRQSDELKEFNELEAYIQSNEFKTAKSQILALKYQGSDDFRKEKQYQFLKKSKPIINYFQVLNSTDYQKYNQITTSDNLARYHELDQYLKSDKHRMAKQEIESTFKQEQQKKVDYLNLKKSKAVKTYLKTSNSALLANYNQMNDAPELTELEELSVFVNSEEFLQKKKEPDYKKSEEYTKELRYKKLLKDKKIINYKKFSQSAAFQQYQSFGNSKEWEDYQALETYVLSPEYLKTLESLKYINSDEYKLETEFNQLKNNSDIRFWENYSRSKALILFNETESSETLTTFQTLEEYINSDEFKQNKAYLLDKNKFEKTEEFQKEKRYNELKNSQNIKWFLSVDKSNKFDELKAWKITFEEDFGQPGLDDAKWMNSFFWGKMLLNDRYVLAGDKQYYTDNKNIEINQSVLKIITRKEKANGKVWHPQHGFSQQDFDYTSGMLSTAHSFRQAYGRFEAKIKIDTKFPVYQAFWLKGEQIVPQIDVFNFNLQKSGQLQMNQYITNGNKDAKASKISSKLGASSLGKDFFIYSIEWSPEKITWKINGVEAFASTSQIPNEPMYLMLSAGIQKNAPADILPSTFEIDWVRCFEKSEN